MFSFRLHFIYEKSSFESKPVCGLKSKTCCRKGGQCINDTIRGKELLRQPPGPSLTRNREEYLQASAGGSTDIIRCWKGRPRAVCLCLPCLFPKPRQLHSWVLLTLRHFVRIVGQEKLMHGIQGSIHLPFFADIWTSSYLPYRFRRNSADKSVPVIILVAWN